MKFYKPLLVGLLVVLAGCSGTSPGAEDTGTSTETPTVTATPTTATTTPTKTASTVAPSSVKYPPGFNSTGWSDKRTALRGHIQSLTEVSFTSTTRTSTAIVRITGNPEQQRAKKILQRNGTTKGTFFYNAGSVQVNGSFYGDVNSYRQAILYDGQFETILGASLANPQVTQRQGQTMITYEVTGQGFDGSLTVTQNGLITNYTVGRVRGDRSVNYEVTNIGNTTVSSPD